MVMVLMVVMVELVKMMLFCVTTARLVTCIRFVRVSVVVAVARTVLVWVCPVVIVIVAVAKIVLVWGTTAAVIDVWMTRLVATGTETGIVVRMVTCTVCVSLTGLAKTVLVTVVRTPTVV
jgi:hypothetical protein